VSVERDYIYELWPSLALLFIPQVMYEWIHNGMTLTGEAVELGENQSQCKFVHHKSHGELAGVRGERPATSRLSRGTVLENSLFWHSGMQ
jgi:hypothetical protein